MKDWLKILVVFALIIGSAWWTLSSAIDCGNKGGRYVPGSDHNWPMCVQEVK